MKILMVLTSHDKLGDTGQKTGFWIEEFAAPYYAFLDAGASITLTSPKGGQPPVDPKSALPEAQTHATKRYHADKQAQEQLAGTVLLSSVSSHDYDAVFYPGGHGPLWDLVSSPHSISLIEDFWKHGKPVSFVCHAPAVLVDVKGEGGEPLVKDRRVTGFTNLEEAAVGLTDIVPFLLEDALKAKGALFESGPEWQPYPCQDGLLITGQNPASSEAVARAVISMLKS